MSRILFADPDPTLRKALAKLLVAREPSIDWRGVEDQDDLEKCLEDFCPHVVVLDWSILRENAETQFCTLRQRCQNIAIIVMSVDQDVMNISLRLGADDFLLKSFSPEQVLNLLRQYLHSGDDVA